ncbi:glutamine-hydrolyzing GMP synthase [bacterium]|nr:glutamine-hydrolyzing GMP synthase [bacterium]MBU1754048.1 glutamine-hydrolyzing GMP synthase [bacterium]
MLKHNEMIIVLDFGSQYTQLIARRIREMNVYCEILPFDTEIKDIKGIKGIILSGGPASVYDEQAPCGNPEMFQYDLPILGICYGLQWMVQSLGGEIIQASKREYGRSEMTVTKSDELFSEIPTNLSVWMSHGDQAARLPEGFTVLAKTENAPYTAIRGKENLYGVQFHPEVAHTEYGINILKNFLFKICKCSGSWTMSSFIKESVEDIRARVGKEKVICALSGGIDSSAVAVLLREAIGDQLTCIFVNNGLLRKGEVAKVIKTFQDDYHINMDFVDAEERFLNKLKGVASPEKKRKIIGREFIRIFEEEAKRLEGAAFLAQGTLYPDVIESVSAKGPSAIIKTHHNVGGLPKRMKLKLIEPFRELFKDEVRVIAKEMGMPNEIIWQHPFPGPGLAVRILGSIDKMKLDTLRDADAIIIEEINNAGIYRDIWQVFGVFLPIKTVGVMGDKRTYENVVAIRAVISQDAMTADWAPLSHDLLSIISNRIVNEVPRINRVVYDITSKPPGTIEWE